MYASHGDTNIHERFLNFIPYILRESMIVHCMEWNQITQNKQFINHSDGKDNYGRTIDDEDEAISKHDCVDVKLTPVASISSRLAYWSSS